MQLYLWNGSQYRDFADYPSNPPFLAPDGWAWTEGDLPDGAQPYIELSLIQKIQHIITEGQAALTTNPLPIDVQQKILQLLSFLKTYFENNAFDVMKAEIQDFAVTSGRSDMTTTQYTTVSEFHQALLALFP